VWIGLKNSDDVGTRFDLRAEVYQNGTTLIATGELDSVWGGSSGFNNARLNTIPLTLIGPVGWPEGSTLTFKRNLSKNRGKLAGRLTKRINTLLHAFYVYVISEPS